MNLADRSRLNWVEASYHFTKMDLLLELQLNGGAAFSEHGALQPWQMVQMMATYYF